MRLNGSRIIVPAAYCNQITEVPLQTYTVHKNVGLLNHSVAVITFILAQSDCILCSNHNYIIIFLGHSI